MASDKKIKADAAAKSEPAATDKSTSGAASAKAESSATSADAPAHYSRGEGQKPVSQAYRDNWNAIFANKTRAKKKKR